MSGSAPPTPPPPTIRKAECSECGGPRQCDIRGHHRTSYSEAGFWGQTDWYLLQCRGCEFMFAQKSVTTSEDYFVRLDADGDEVSGYEETHNYWPALSKRARPDWIGDYGIHEVEDVAELDVVLVELYGALNANLPVLATIGVRTSFDVASKLLQVDPELTFAKKLDALVDGKLIREADRSALELAVEAGNASAHRGWKPKPAELDVVMDILENFIFDAFVQPNRRKKREERAVKVRGAVPARTRSIAKAPAAKVAVPHPDASKPSGADAAG